MEEEPLYDRIGEADLNPIYKDGQVYQHTDVNNMLSILKTAVNENYHDIQKLENGTKDVEKAKTLDGATLSRYLDETLQANDNKVPSSQQAKAYVDNLFAEYSPPIRGVDYWTEEDKEEIIDEAIEESQLKPKGDYDPTVEYKKLDIVLYQNSSYVALQTTQGNLPTDTDYWQILVSGELSSEDIVDNLESNYSDKVLSAKQGKVLNEGKLQVFNTVANMKADTSLKAGMTVKTNGYYNANDGGHSNYRIRAITNEDVIDEMTLIELSDESLVAELIVEYPVNPIKLGAKADGITDDSSFIQRAINLGNVRLERKTFKVDNTLTVNGNKVIDLQKATLIGSANPFFKVNNTGATAPLTWITIKNGRIETTGNGIKVYDSYFIKIEDMSIKLLGTTGSGIYIENGFNNTLNNNQIYGLDNNNNTCVGIEYSIVNNESIGWINNVTNVQFNSCLIQRVNKGVYLHGVSGGSFDSCMMSNMGFSACTDTALELGTNSGNWEIINTRCEYSEQLAKISSGGQANIQGIYILNSKGIDNAGFLEMSGNIYHVSTDSVNRYTILSNTGTIRFGAIGRWGNSGTTICDNTVKLTNMVASTKMFYTTSTNIFFPQYINMKYTGSLVYTVADIIAPEGAEMYLLRRDSDSGWLLPDGSYTARGTLYHLVKLNGVWNII